MSGGRFLVSLREVIEVIINLEKILTLNSIIKANRNFWEENIYAENTIDSVTSEIHTRLDKLKNEISECQLNEESKEVDVSKTASVVKTFSSRSACNQYKKN